MDDRRESSALACLVAAVFAVLPWPVWAQGLGQPIPGEEPGARSPAAAAGGRLATPAAATEASGPFPGTVPPVPIEESLDPSLYICGRGDVFELNFWGRQNFRNRVTV